MLDVVGELLQRFSTIGLLLMIITVVCMNLEVWLVVACDVWIPSMPLPHSSIATEI
jgi:hypothetical protein